MSEDGGVAKAGPKRTVSNSIAKKKPDSLAQLAAVQFGARKKGIKTVLTSSVRADDAPVSHHTSRGRRIGAPSSAAGGVPTSRHDSRAGQTRTGSQHGTAATTLNPEDEHSAGSASFSFLDVEANYKTGLSAYQKKMVLNARRKPKFDESVLTEPNDPTKRRLVMLDDRLRNGAAGYARNLMQTAKYSLVTFIPRCLWEQIHLPINLIFLALVAFNVYSQSYESSFLSLRYQFAIWIAIRMLKEYSEDLKRARTDSQENVKRSLVLDPNQLRAVATKSSFVAMAWGDIVVGDIVQVQNGERFPADMVLLAVEPLEGQCDGECFIDSSNVDGDMNLSLKTAVDVTSIFKTGTCLRRLKGLRFDRQRIATERTLGALSCDRPSRNLDSFDGILGVDIREAAAQMQREEIERCNGMPLEQHPKVQRILKEELSRQTPSSGYSHVLKLSLSNLALRGTRLVYTAAAIGVVVFAGHDCKVVQNWRRASRRPKRSHLMKQLDSAMLLILGIRLLFAVLSFEGNDLFARGISFVTSKNVVTNLGLPPHINLSQFWHMYLNDPGELLVSWTYFFFLYGGIGSLSIWITLELCMTSQGVSISSDRKLWEQTNNLTNKPSIMTSNVNADLGQIEYVFLEKLGLLTTGAVEVALMNCNGIEYGADNAALIEHLWDENNAERQARVRLLATIMACCNSITSRIKLSKEQRHLETTIKRDEKFFNQAFEYRSSSPFEVAMVEAAKAFGYEFKSRDGPILRIAVKTPAFHLKKIMEDVKILAINSMSSRGRMSVVVQRSDSEVILYCKGWARDTIDRCIDVHRQTFDVFGALDRYGRAGFRTMVIAERRIPLTYFHNIWLPLYYRARNIDPNHVKWTDRDPITREMLLSPDLTPQTATLQFLAGQIETKLRFVALVAFKDIVEDAIPAMIERMQVSGIKFWMSTTESLTAARAAAYRAKMITPAMIQLRLLSSPTMAATKVTDKFLNERHMGDPIEADPDIDPRLVPPTLDQIYERSLAERASAQPTPEQDAARLDAVCRRLRIELFDYHARYLNQALDNPLSLFLDAVAFNLIIGDAVMSSILFGLCGVADIVVLAQCSPDDKARAVRFVRTRGNHLPLDKARASVKTYWHGIRNADRHWRAVRNLLGGVIRFAWHFVMEGCRDEIVTLAVARGSSDIVQMSAAHVGVAIGNISLTHANEAVLCSDYSMPRFAQLGRLVLVHGHWQYHRLCQVASLSIYKSMILPTIQFLYGAFNGYSAVIFIPSVIQDMFDLALTLLPVLVTGIGDKDVSDDIAENDPRVYFRNGTRRSEFGLGHTLRATLNGIAHGISIFFMTMASINAWGSLEFRSGLSLFATSAVDNNSVGSLYSSGILTFFVACATVLVKINATLTTPSLNVAFLSLVSLLAAYFWVQVGASVDSTLGPDVNHGIAPFRYALIIALIAFTAVVFDMTLRRIRYLTSPTLAEKVQALEEYVKKLRTQLLLSNAITASVTFADMYTTLRMRLVPFLEQAIIVAGAKADRFNGTFALLNGNLWESLSSIEPANVGIADPEIVKQRSRSLSLSKSLTASASEASVFVEQTPDGISVRHLSVLRSHSSMSFQKIQSKTSEAPRLKLAMRPSFMMLQMPSIVSSRYSTGRQDSSSFSAHIPNFRHERAQKLSSYAVGMSPFTLRYAPILSTEMDSSQVRRAQSECSEKERSFRYSTEQMCWRTLRLRLVVVGVALLGYSLVQIELANAWGTPRSVMIIVWLSLLIMILDRFRGDATRPCVLLLCILLSVVKSMTLWPMPTDLIPKISSSNMLFSRPELMPLVGAILFPYIILTSIRFYFVDGVMVASVDWMFTNACLALPDSIYAPLVSREIAMLNSFYVALMLVGAYQCYLDERRRRLYFLQCRRYRVLFTLSCSVCDDLVPDSEIGSNTRYEKLRGIDQATTISSFRTYVNIALGAIPSHSSLSATCLVIGIDSLSNLIQHRSPAQSVSLLSKIHETITTMLRRTGAQPDLQISCMGSGHGALLMVYIGPGSTPECESALEMCRIAIRLSELSDPRISKQLFGVMITLSMGIDTGRLVQGPVPYWDVADDDIVPPRIYSVVVGEALQGARVAQTLSDQGQVCIGKRTYQLVQHLYEAELIGAHHHAPATNSRSQSGSVFERTSLELQTEQVDSLSSTISLLRAGLQIRHRKRWFRIVPNCFSGSEVVNLLMSSQSVVSRFDGVRLGNSLIMRNVLVHATKIGREFFDEPDELYRWRISRDFDVVLVINVLKKNLHPATNKRWSRSYPGTFSAIDIVDCLMSKSVTDSRENAIQIGQYLVLKSVLKNEFGLRRAFAYNRDLYQFSASERIDVQALALGLSRNLELKTRTFRGKQYTGSFLGTEAVAFMVDAGLASNAQQALDFGNYLRANDKLRHVSDPTIPFINSNDVYVLTTSSRDDERNSRRALLRISSFHENKFYQLKGATKQERDDLERLINAKGFVRHLGGRVRVERQDARLAETHVPLTRSLKYDIPKLQTTSALAVPWVDLERDYERFRERKLLQRLTRGYDPVNQLVDTPNVLLIFFQAIATAGFALLALYLIIGGALSFLIQSPAWSGRLNQFLELHQCTAAMLLFRLGLQAINTFGFLVVWTSRNSSLVPNLSTVCLAVVFMTATLQNPAQTYIESLLIGLVYFVVFVINVLALDAILIPETIILSVLFLVVLGGQLVVCHDREIHIRRLFFLEWAGNQHRQTVHRLLPRLVPRPIAAHLDGSFEPQGWLCNNVVLCQIEFTRLPKLLDAHKSSPHEAITVFSKLFERFNSICHQHSCMNVLSGGSSYVFICGLRHAQEEFESEVDDGTTGAGQGAVVRSINALQASIKMMRASTDVEKELKLETGLLSVSCGVAIGGVLSAVLPGASLRHSIFGNTVDHAAHLAFTCPEGLVHCSSEIKRLLSRADRPHIKFSFAEARELIPNERSYFVRFRGDPFPTEHSDDKDFDDVMGLSSTFAITRMARKLTKQAQKFRAPLSLDAVDEHDGGVVSSNPFEQLKELHQDQTEIDDSLELKPGQTHVGDFPSKIAPMFGGSSNLGDEEIDQGAYNLIKDSKAKRSLFGSLSNKVTPLAEGSSDQGGDGTAGDSYDAIKAPTNLKPRRFP